MNRKRLDALAALDLGETLVMLDGRHPGVSLPERFRVPQVGVKFSYRYAPGDLELNAWGISATLTFGGVEHFVKVPWVAVFGIRNNAGVTSPYETPAPPPAIVKWRGGLGLIAPVEVEPVDRPFAS